MMIRDSGVTSVHESLNFQGKSQNMMERRAVSWGICDKVSEDMRGERFRDTLPGQSLSEQVDPVQLLWVTGVHHHQTVEVTITHMTRYGT